MIALDAAGALRRGSVTVAGEVCTIRLPFLTETPNGGAWGGSWQLADGIKRAWARRLELAVDASTPAVRRLAKGSRVFPTPAARADWLAPDRRVPVTFSRLVGKGRRLIEDFDNLSFSFKGLIDAVVRAGFLRDDSTKAIEARYIQGRSPDGADWTEIRIDARGEPAGDRS